jgi:murein L,D-transpeptidase YcbB/YkuD
MRALTKKLAFTASAASLMLVLGYSPAIRAEETAPAPADNTIVLPPVPDLTLDLTSKGTAHAPEAPAAAATHVEAPADEPRSAAAAATPEPSSSTVIAAEPTPAPPPSQAAPEITTAVPAAPIATPGPTPAETAEAKPVLDEATEVTAALKTALEQLAREPAKTVAIRREREAVAAFYAARNNAPLWREGGKWTVAARSVLTRLEHADEDAIDLRSTPLPILRDGTHQDLATVELALSLATASYGRQATGSRVDPSSISRLITEKPEIADVSKILTTVASAPDAGAALLDFNPDRESYRLLRTKLAELRREKTNPAAARIDPGPVLKVGMKDPRVPLIRAHFHLGAPETTTSDDLVYDTRVASAVADFQRQNGLPASGQLTARTIAVLSGGQPAALEAEIIANMERWRWLPHAAPADRIEVNIPDYTVRVFRGGQVIHQARVIVGKPNTPTPVFSNTMKFLEVNPYWNVPDSIIKKEMMPKLAADPTYLARMGYQVSTIKGRMVVRQPPGERNALGNIKFMFPNQHAVYLHDTPTRGLFKTDRRAYSHGCVRVDSPFKLAEIVLGKENGWSEDRVRRMVGTGNRTIQLPKHIDIDIGYFTAFVDDGGKLQVREDIYGYSRKLKVALGLEG